MIEKVIIENFKSIKYAEIALDRLNILIGPNGAGKSNFIHFFELVHHILNQNLGGFLLSNGGMDRFLYQGKKHSDFIKGLVDFNNENAFFFTLKDGLGDKGYLEETGNWFNVNPSENSKDYSKWERTTLEKNVEETLVSNLCPDLYKKTFLNGFAVYHFHDTSKNSKMRGACNVDDNASLRRDGSNLAAFLYRLKLQNTKDFMRIENAVRAVAPYFSRFKMAPMTTNPSMIKLEWEEKNSDMYLDAYSFSDGTLRFIALATALLQPELPDTVIIDEPELGLHPSAINLLCGLIKKAAVKSQLIISSQSVGIVNNFNPEEIIVVDRKNDNTVFSRLNPNDLEIWLDQFSIGEIWEKNLIGGRP